MSKADEMFKKIGYIQSHDFWGNITYSYKNYFKIVFDVPMKDISFVRKEHLGFFKYNRICLKQDDIQAINEKCKELGWIK